MGFTERTYRNKIFRHDLVSYQVKVRETDLYISSDTDLTQVALRSVHKYRGHLESYIRINPDFLTSLTPIDQDHLAPDIVRDMLSVSSLAGVGPMASVAGAVAEHVGRDLLRHNPNVIVENGGDIFLNTLRDITVGIFAGDSPLSEKIALRVHPSEMPAGICTSSATVGPSLSLGRADAVCVKSRSASLADAAATAIGNVSKSKSDIRKAISRGCKINGVLGILIIMGTELGVWGEMELI